MYVTPLCYGVTAVSYRFKKEGEYFYDFDAYNMVKWLTLKRIQWIKPLSQVSGPTENIFIKKSNGMTCNSVTKVFYFFSSK